SRKTMKQSFTPVRVGRYSLPNRLVMAPMTRSRAKFDGTPGERAAEYYAQRASVGLIVTEGTQPSDDGQGYLATPGIYTPAHIAGWKRVTAAVHDKDGHIFIQIMHAGRMSHPEQYATSPPARRTLRDRAGGADVHRHGNEGHSRAAPADDRGSAPDRRRLPPRSARRHRGWRRWCRASWRKFLSHPAVLRPER